jgi:hypothetical protein
MKAGWYLFALVVSCPAPGQAPSVAKAEMFYRHGLVEDAKRTAIEALFAMTTETAKAPARLLLARISLAEDRLGDAASLWASVVQAAPDSEEGKVASRMLEGCSDSLALAGKDTVQSAVAGRYLDAARFWLSGLDASLDIDTNWLDREAAAVRWLDRVITEFPGTEAAEIAHEYRVRAFLGVSGREPRGLGGSGALGAASRVQDRTQDAEHRNRFSVFMKQAESALMAMESAFPKSSRLQRIRFMIVDAYWRMNDRDAAEPWLQAIVKSAGTAETFWSQLARLRLKNWRN